MLIILFCSTLMVRLEPAIEACHSSLLWKLLLKPVILLWASLGKGRRYLGWLTNPPFSPSFFLHSALFFLYSQKVCRLFHPIIAIAWDGDAASFAPILALKLCICYNAWHEIYRPNPRHPTKYKHIGLICILNLTRHLKPIINELFIVVIMLFQADEACVWK